MHGGADLFGLALLREHDLFVPADPLHTLITRISLTDIDLIDTTASETEPGMQVGGVHYSEGIPAEWRRTARKHGVILLLTGPR